MKKLLSLTLCAALILSLAACGGAGPSDVAASLAKAQEAAAGLRSVQSDMDMDMSYTIITQGEALDVTTTMSMSTQSIMEPLTAYSVISMDVMGVEMDVYSYVVQQGDSYAAYASLDGAEWVAQELPEEQLAQLDTMQGAKFYLSAAEGFAYGGQEELDGQKLHRYDGELSGDFLSQAVEYSGMDTLLSSYGASADTVFEGSMPMSIWLDAETFAPVRYELDMSQVVSGFLQSMFAEQGAEMEDASVLVSIRLSNFNSIDSIEAPAGIE